MRGPIFATIRLLTVPWLCRLTRMHTLASAERGLKRCQTIGSNVCVSLHHRRRLQLQRQRTPLHQHRRHHRRRHRVLVQRSAQRNGRHRSQHCPQQIRPLPSRQHNFPRLARHTDQPVVQQCLRLPVPLAFPPLYALCTAQMILLAVELWQPSAALAQRELFALLIVMRAHNHPRRLQRSVQRQSRRSLRHKCPQKPRRQAPRRPPRHPPRAGSRFHQRDRRLPRQRLHQRRLHLLHQPRRQQSRPQHYQRVHRQVRPRRARPVVPQHGQPHSRPMRHPLHLPQCRRRHQQVHRRIIQR
mmetsp:Transcript_1812/g.4590  ORF Transcript_1812/g.4590 Transcript_1812/m.4590 type:complete len:299 (+) Transcript_1812:1920-2816(+)